MTFLHGDLLLVLVPLAGLVLIVRYRKLLRDTDRQSYRHISGGICLLAVVTLMDLFESRGLLSIIPLVSNSAVIELMKIMGGLAGTILTVSGVSQWLPISREYRHLGSRNLFRLNMIKKIQQLVSIEGRPRVVMSKGLDIIVNHCQAGFGAAYLLRPGTPRPLLVSWSGDHVHADEIMDKIQLNYETLCQWTIDNTMSLDEIIGTSTDSGVVSHVQPICSGENLCGIIVLCTNKTGMEDIADEKMNLELAVDIIERRIGRDRHRRAADLKMRRRSWKNVFLQSINSTNPVKDSVAHVAQQVYQMTGTDYVSLAIKDDRAMYRQFSIMRGGSVLQELSLSLGQAPEHLTEVFASGQEMYRDDILTDTDRKAKQRLLDAGLCSLVSIPIVTGKVVRGVLVVAAREGGLFDSKVRSRLKWLAGQLGEIVSDEFTRTQIATSKRRQASLGDLLRNVSEGVEFDKACQLVAGLVFSELRTSVVRVSTFDSGEPFILSRALISAEGVDIITPADGFQVLSLMPYHQLLLETGRVMLVNQAGTDRRMDIAEARQTFGPDIKSALIVPIKSQGRMIGCIGAADCREWEQYQYSSNDIDFVRTMASTLGLLHSVTSRGFVGEIRKSVVGQSVPVPGDKLRDCLKSSLTSIMGSVELINSQESLPAEQRNRYLSIIEKSARKLNDVVESY